LLTKHYAVVAKVPDTKLGLRISENVAKVTFTGSIKSENKYRKNMNIIYAQFFLPI